MIPRRAGKARPRRILEARDLLALGAHVGRE